MSDHKLADVAVALRGKRILIVGDVILDEYVFGDARRLSPESPVPLLEFRQQTHVPGGAANTAVNVKALGGEPLLAGMVGADAAAEKLLQALRETGIDVSGVRAAGERVTTTKTRIVAHHQHVVRIDRERRQPLSAAQERALLEWVQSQLPRADACILSDYAKGVATPRVAEGFISQARQAGKPLIVDPKKTDYAKYRGASLIKPNLHEAELFLGREITDEAALLEVGQRLMDLLGGTAVLITRGAEGMSLFRRDLPPLHMPALARHVFDVTGAGDTVVSTLALALAAGAPLEVGIDLANRAAGIVVGKVGTAAVTREELLAAL